MAVRVATPGLAPQLVVVVDPGGIQALVRGGVAAIVCCGATGQRDSHIPSRCRIFAPGQAGLV